MEIPFGSRVFGLELGTFWKFLYNRVQLFGRTLPTSMVNGLLTA